jgi:hypothetical protein
MHVFMDGACFYRASRMSYGDSDYSQHILEPDLTSDESADLNRVVVPLCSSASCADATPQLSEPSSFASHLGAVLSSGFHTDQLPTTAMNTVSNKETSIPIGLANENVCDGELRNNKLQTPSQKHKACHFVLKKLDLEGAVELTAKRLKLYNTLQTKDSALHKLRKKYRAKELKEVCCLVGSHLRQSMLF